MHIYYFLNVVRKYKFKSGRTGSPIGDSINGNGQNVGCNFLRHCQDRSPRPRPSFLSVITASFATPYYDCTNYSTCYQRVAVSAVVLLSILHCAAVVDESDHHIISLLRLHELNTYSTLHNISGHRRRFHRRSPFDKTAAFLRGGDKINIAPSSCFYLCREVRDRGGGGASVACCGSCRSRVVVDARLNYHC